MAMYAYFKIHFIDIMINLITKGVYSTQYTLNSTQFTVHRLLYTGYIRPLAVHRNLNLKSIKQGNYPQPSGLSVQRLWVWISSISSTHDVTICQWIVQNVTKIEKNDKGLMTEIISRHAHKSLWEEWPTTICCQD